ncbi:hypothetical protein [Rhizobium sp. BK602]|uniref:hypothetical protein n=1 Tax=Rhizobium sp. BK602 TaxID=2586986 RepID=UPI001619B6D1|nr:hypothetical protein [Rhizobium sp. BK602]MBB3609147.1 hypothetical protein [Rhizobium sp. BK602]
MKVFGLRYLESMTADAVEDASNWSWKPANAAALRVYASGNSTKSRESTYAAERDNREDEDRPNEGLAA